MPLGGHAGFAGVAVCFAVRRLKGPVDPMNSWERGRRGTGAIYQHPLAYVLGLEGIALLRAFAGQYDREFTLARIREIRALLDAADDLGDGVEETPIAVRDGYAQWASSYDEPGNELLEVEEPVVRKILAALPVGSRSTRRAGRGATARTWRRSATG